MQPYRIPSSPENPPHSSSSSDSTRFESHSPISQPRSPRSDSSRDSSQFSPDFMSSAYTAYSATSSDVSSRKRLREAAEHDELSPWECHPTYGIVHPSGCSICRPYMSHIAESKHAHSTSIERAFKDLDHQLDTYFFDGLTEGRRRQRAEDQDQLRDLERYRAGRNDALTTAARYRSEAHDANEQLSILQGQLRLAQSECDVLRKRLESERLKQSASEGVDGLEVEKMLLDTNSPVQVDPTVSAVPPISATPEDPCGLRSSIPLSQNPTSAQVDTAVSSAPPVSATPEDPSGSRSNPTSYAAAVASTIPSSMPLSAPPSVNLPPRPIVDGFSSSPSVDLRATPAYVRPPKTLRQLQHLMHTAHQPGNDAALAKVKLLCAEAHQTPRDEKTELHRYILANWRNPPEAPGASASPPPAPLLLPNAPLLPARANNPRMDDPVEVWHAYLTAHPGSWPRGVRRAPDGSPHLGDLRASRAVARLRPAIGARGDTTARTAFTACAAQLFAAPGMYADLLRRGGLVVAETKVYAPYRATQFSVTPAEVARHFARAGVSVAEAEAELEPWAQEYQAAVVFPTGSTSTKSYGGYSSSAAANAYHWRARERDSEERFGWR